MVWTQSRNLLAFACNTAHCPRFDSKSNSILFHFVPEQFIYDAIVCRQLLLYLTRRTIACNLITYIDLWVVWTHFCWKQNVYRENVYMNLFSLPSAGRRMFYRRCHFTWGLFDRCRCRNKIVKSSRCIFRHNHNWLHTKHFGGYARQILCAKSVPRSVQRFIAFIMMRHYTRHSIPNYPHPHSAYACGISAIKSDFFGTNK